jgi:hypothetical protein
MINISFAITVCDEAFELDRLLNQLNKCVIEGDEIIIQVDTSNTTPEVLNVVSSYEGKYNSVLSRLKEKIVSPTKIFYPLNNNFAEFKNNIKKHCNNEYIFFIDADEEVTQDQIHLIREILEMNPTVDCYAVPRINTVKGLTKEHVGQWGWRIDKLEEHIEEKEFDLNNPQDLAEYNLLKKYDLIIEENKLPLYL